MADELDRRAMPWLKAGFDWESVAAAAGALLIALLLGWIWSPLFWVGFAAVIVSLAAGRWSRRTPPDIVEGVVAPCDGVIVSIELSDVPNELRFAGQTATRIRIASAPVSTNKVYAPIAGSIEALGLTQGEASVPLAMSPDDEGLTRAFATFESQGEQVGIRLVSGGLGPRIELLAEAGGITRLGRVFATRRLGGWCDVFLASGRGLMVWEGQSVTGGETVIGRLKVEPTHAGDFFEADDAVLVEKRGTTPAPATTSEPEPEVEFFDDDYLEPDEISVPEDPAAIFARLREAARKHGESD